MTMNSPETCEPGPAELPTRAAHVTVDTQPARVRLIIGRDWMTAQGSVPSGAARYLITVFGVLGSVVTGIAGAVVTVRIARQLAPVAVGELIVALVAAVLIAVGAYTPHRISVHEPATSDAPKPASAAGEAC